jgi:hypothetical protein
VAAQGSLIDQNARLRRRLGWFARNVTAREAANYFAHAGYA